VFLVFELNKNLWDFSFNLEQFYYKVCQKKKLEVLVFIFRIK